MRSVLVTGGTIRIGKAIAECLRLRGWQVVTSSHRADSGADLIADLSDPDAVGLLFERARERAGGVLDAVVNNAALFTGDGRTLFAVNLEAPRRLTCMLSNDAAFGASVVNLVDLKTDEDDYGKSKRALIAWTRESALRFAPRLRVNAVAPGPVLAPVGVHVPAGAILAERRPGPDDVAGAVAYLLEARSVTGVVLPVDGGQHLLLDGCRDGTGKEVPDRRKEDEE